MSEAVGDGALVSVGVSVAVCVAVGASKGVSIGVLVSTRRGVSCAASVSVGVMVGVMVSVDVSVGRVVRDGWIVISVASGVDVAVRVGATVGVVSGISMPLHAVRITSTTSKLPCKPAERLRLKILYTMQAFLCPL